MQIIISRPLLLPVPAQPVQVPKSASADKSKVVAKQEAESCHESQACHYEIDDAQEQISSADP